MGHTAKFRLRLCIFNHQDMIRGTLVDLELHGFVFFDLKTT